VEEDKGKYITFELKTRVGQPSDATKYKKHVRIFEEGSPQEWIDLLKDLDEIWTQNSMSGGTDRAATVRTLVKGESAVTFEAALQDARKTTEDGPLASINIDNINLALEAVKASVFPHRALEIQRSWMNRNMFKPIELTTRQMSAAINRLNNALPYFPQGSEASKFSEKELVELLEYSLPRAWRTKFDLDGYVPTDHSKTRLIEACEAIERNELLLDKTKSKEDTSHSNKKAKNYARSSSKPGEKQKQSSVAKHFCTEHGHNPTHSTADCWTLKNRSSKSSGFVPTKNKHSFSNKNLRKEINLLAKQSSKRKVLDMYATFIKKEQSKLDKKSAKRQKTSDSDDEMSVNVISPRKQKSSKASEMIAEEKDYQKKLQWLKDHGDSTGTGSSDESSSN
jgi:hypothetical protein